MVVGIELARAMEPLTFFQVKVFNAQLAIRYKSATKLNTQTYCEKTRRVTAMPQRTKSARSCVAAMSKANGFRL